jgi:hypothetical protein
MTTVMVSQIVTTQLVQTTLNAWRLDAQMERRIKVKPALIVVVLVHPVRRRAVMA